ncbi:hypothetical protein HGO48_05990 [Wolbachia endosymbiont of Diaphorina citri]|jgi:hypothetical protein|uniref:hypothetical protein n=1 Tax=unclassified Wolbachia TaxID=2640676 RepID=UPI0003092480|nr:MULTISPECIES: hypothetical protein [unclassified Wolbachia]OAB82381.1 hypothetical protein WSTR_00940 [Wolbachia endosymbiont of Laodelphax striatellus]QJT94869.1 hypothetical protein HGO48_05990 [Wolbachia endosymbiont of Diaphorina citri]QJT96182.1 hypothetical protein HGO49_06550 [Wolbachia endosymbiont of Diaphorina citri]QLK11817.1 hypothetical protein FK497_06435 [Wolbachia endosymbiont of Diaphorina citri]
MAYHSDNQLQRGFVSGNIVEWMKGRRAPEKSDDQSIQPEPTIQHTYDDCMKICLRGGKDKDFASVSICKIGCGLTNSDTFQHHLPQPTFSEKLTNIANNLLVESEQLSSMADSLEPMVI